MNEKNATTSKGTPILGLLPTHSDAEVSARYQGYVQGVKATASKTVDKLQAEAAKPVAAAEKARAKKVSDASSAKRSKISDIERRMTKARQKLDSLRRRLLDEAKAAYVRETDDARTNFKETVKPIEAGLEVSIRAVAEDTATKITAASAEFGPVFEAAAARRSEAERVAKELQDKIKEDVARAAAEKAAAGEEKPLVAVA